MRDEEILQATLKEFGQRGQLLRVEDVTTAVGIGKGTLYRHYDSRLNLLRAALAYGVRELQARAVAARNAAADTDADRGLTATVAALARMNAERDLAAPAVLARLRDAENWPTPLDADCEPIAALRPLVARWQDEGLLDAHEDADWIGSLIVGAVNAPVAAAAADADALGARVSAIVRRAFPS